MVTSKRVVFQPAARLAMQRGINKIAAAVSPTLGPYPRYVAIDRFPEPTSPFLLDNGGLIARKIINLANPDEDMGAMLLRHVIWKQQTSVGDGTVTTALIFQSVFNQGVRYLTAGGNAMRLRYYLECGLSIILRTLDGMAQPVQGKEKLAQLAETICHDPALARLLGEIIDIIGEYGRLEIRPGRSRNLEREYIEGFYWRSSVFSRDMLTDRVQLKTEMENVAILISDYDITEPGQVHAIVERANDSQSRTLLILARSFSEKAVSALRAVSRDPERFQGIAIRTPGMDIFEQATGLEDMAILTGGRPFIQATGQSIGRLTVADFGYAQRVWADREHFGLVGGCGDPRLVRQHLAKLRQAVARATAPPLRRSLNERIGKLTGGAATLWVGDVTERAIKAREEVATRTIDAMRVALIEGVVPGGGASLIACQPPLRQSLAQAEDADEQAAYQILIRALEMPFRTLLENAGYDASERLAALRQCSPEFGFDLRNSQIVEMDGAGIVDPVAVLKAAIRHAVSGASSALSIDVLVHRKNLAASEEP